MQNTKRVLVAEDQFLVSEMISGLLKQMEYTIVGKATDGCQAVDMCQELKPDVILMDIQMPECDGIEACRRIQENCPTPVVMLTAYENQDLVRQASDAGAGAYLIKPPNIREIDRAITIAVARFDDMMRLRKLNQELRELNADKEDLIEELRATIDNIRTLRNLLPICSSCKRIRDDEGYWHQLEDYIRSQTGTQFSHGLCPECMAKYYKSHLQEPTKPTEEEKP